MTISKDLYLIMKDNSMNIFSELTNEITKRFHGVKIKEWVYAEEECWQKIDNTGEISNSFDDIIKVDISFGDSEGLSFQFIKHGLINSFLISYSTEIVKEEKHEIKNFWGKSKIEIESKSIKLDMYCYPFIDSKKNLRAEDLEMCQLADNSEKGTPDDPFDNYYSKASSLSLHYSGINNFANYTAKILKQSNKNEEKLIHEIQSIVNNIILNYSNKLNIESNSMDNQINLIDKKDIGKADIIDTSELMTLLIKNQTKILEIDKDYIHKFIRIVNYLKKRNENIQTIFSKLSKAESLNNKKELFGILENNIHSYELLTFHTINMIGAISDNDLITFYEIYESFDKLGIFNSNWENEVSEKLTNIGDKLDDLMYSIYNMEQNIVSELNNLNYVTQSSFEDLNRSVTSQLKEVESSINSNNLLAGIQAYQLYKINKNTKSLRG